VEAAEAFPPPDHPEPTSFVEGGAEIKSCLTSPSHRASLSGRAAKIGWRTIAEAEEVGQPGTGNQLLVADKD